MTSSSSSWTCHAHPTWVAFGSDLFALYAQFSLASWLIMQNNWMMRSFELYLLNIVNSRPLTIDNLSDPEAPKPITPNHLLTFKTKVVLPPPGNFSRPELYSRRRRCRIQYLSEQFWHRWQLEYCLLQQIRQKWNNVSPNSRVGNIVLMRSESSPRNQWPLARVMKVYSSDDGLVCKVLLLVTQSGERKFFWKTNPQVDSNLSPRWRWKWQLIQDAGDH